MPTNNPVLNRTILIMTSAAEAGMATNYLIIPNILLTLTAFS